MDTGVKLVLLRFRDQIPAILLCLEGAGLDSIEAGFEILVEFAVIESSVLTNHKLLQMIHPVCLRDLYSVTQ